MLTQLVASKASARHLSLMPVRTAVERALIEGARRSRMACSLPARDPVAVRIWRRYKWAIIGAGLFLFIELIGLGSLASGARGHF
jgi:hypothetical protein